MTCALKNNVVNVQSRKSGKLWDEEDCKCQELLIQAKRAAPIRQWSMWDVKVQHTKETQRLKEEEELSYLTKVACQESQAQQAANTENVFVKCLHGRASQEAKICETRIGLLKGGGSTCSQTRGELQCC